jgi:hypothetical protein
MQGVPDAIVALGVGDPAVLALATPDCGCDACDDGSARLVDEFDEHVMSVVTGEFVHVGTKNNTTMSTGSGSSARGKFANPRCDVDHVLAEARSGRSPHPVVRGARWW